VGGIKAAIEVEQGASEISSHLLGYLLQGFQALGKEHHIRFIGGSHGDRSQDSAVVVGDGDNFLPLLVLGA
jgi:hypothetical protein